MIALPMPVPPPVTIADFPAKSNGLNTLVTLAAIFVRLKDRSRDFTDESESKTHIMRESMNFK